MQIIICAQTLGSFLILFRALSFRSYHNIYRSFGIFLVVKWSFGSFDCSLHLLMLLHLVIFLQSFDPQYSLIPSKYSSLDMCIDSTHIMRNAHIMEELSLYWPSRFFPPISAMDANGGEVSRV